MDSGSPLYVEVMNKVPVVVPKDFACVNRPVRETSLWRMVAGPPGPAASAGDDAEGCGPEGPGGSGEQQVPSQQGRSWRLLFFLPKLFSCPTVSWLLAEG